MGGMGVGHVACLWEMVSEEPEGKRPSGRPRDR